MPNLTTKKLNDKDLKKNLVLNNDREKGKGREGVGKTAKPNCSNV